MNAGNLARKSKRNKREELLFAETMNGQAINRLMKQDVMIAQDVLVLKKTFNAVLLCLKRQRIVDDFMIGQATNEIDEYQRMESKALVIDPHKPEKPEKKGP
jgi:hypothetical protein